MALQLLGHSLEDLFCNCKRKYSLQTVLLLCEQMLLRLEYLHSKNYIHRDIKPDNFCIGCDEPKTIYLIDYGLAIKYKDPNTGEHVRFGRQRNLTGTARYASLNAHLGYDQSRRDDLEGLGYVMVYFLKGMLPWQGLPGDNKKEKYNKITELKQNTSPSALCSGIPNEFALYFDYVKKLKFEEKPDYNYLRMIFRDLFHRSNLQQTFDWESIANTSPSKPKYKNQDEGSKNNTIKLQVMSFAKRPLKNSISKEKEIDKEKQENGKEKKSSNDQGGKIVDDMVTKQSTHKDIRMYMPTCNKKLKAFIDSKHKDDMEIPDDNDRVQLPIITDYIQESKVSIDLSFCNP